MKRWMGSVVISMASMTVLTAMADHGLPTDHPALSRPPSPEKLQQWQQWREIRLQQAIANGDVSAEEAANIRQRWQKQAELMDKWQKGTLTPEERAKVEKALEKRKKRWEKRDQDQGDHRGKPGKDSGKQGKTAERFPLI